MKHLRILNVEDSQDDLALILRYLKRGGYEVYSERVETAEEMQKALDSKDWDIILSDFRMPHFTGLQALEVLKQSGRDIPFIIISGTIGEDVAVEAMQAGINDYIMKSNLSRLLPAIEREIQEAQNRRARQEAEIALQASEAELRALFEAMSDLILAFDEEGRYLKVAPTARELLYKSSDSLIGKTLHEVFPKEEADFFLDYIRRALDEKRTQRVEYKMLIEGVETWFDSRISPLSEKTVIWIARDITERRLAEEAVRRQKEILQRMFDHIPIMLCFFDRFHRIQLVNREWERVRGWTLEEIQTENIDVLSESYPNEEERRRVQEFLSEATGEWQEFLVKGKDGRETDATFAVVALSDGTSISIGQDITARKRAEEELRKSEEQLIQSQKLESIGRLAGGVAHDFNNLLTAINGYSDLSLRRLKTDDPIRNNIEEIKKAGERAAALTRQLLAFSRKQVMQPKIVDLNTIILDMEKMLQRLIGEDIELRTVIESELGTVKADPGQIEQVIMNLVINARDAMPQGGILTIETANVYLDEPYATYHISAKPGSYVMLAVSDTGTGMDEETKQHIFEPFFTTKEPGKGTGLGLATVYGIVKQSEGNIWAYSELGKGTSFKIYLPQLGSVTGGREKTGAGDNSLQKGTETILLVEDEDVVRHLSLEILESCGYKVIQAENGIEAMNKCGSNNCRIDLLVTDVVMPQMGGRELAERLSGIYPDMKVLFTSGYTDDAVVRHGIIDEGTNFIQKPFTLDAFAKKVRQLLDSSG